MLAGSGENGAVVVSLSSPVRNMTEEKANVITPTLAQIPQKVTESVLKAGKNELVSFTDKFLITDIYHVKGKLLW